MTVLVDTSVLVAYLHAGDARHVQAKALMHRIFTGKHGQPFLTHDVLDEGLTLLQRRGAGAASCRAFAGFALRQDGQRPPLGLRTAMPDQVEGAVQMFLQRFDRGLSMTDCLIAVLALEMGAVVASFDGGFDGIVPRIEA